MLIRKTGKAFSASGGFALAGAWLLSLPAIAQGPPQIAIGGYAIPTANTSPLGITAGPDGAVWFTEFFGNNIGRITSAGAITEYPVPTADCEPFQITAGPDGALWFTEYSSNKIARITTAGIITEYPLPTRVSEPSWITAGPDGALWFSADHYNSIVRMTTAGVVTNSYNPPSASNGVYGITVGRDGALWFTEINTNRIGRITTAGVITEYPAPTVLFGPYGGPNGITTGPDGEIWFTENRGIQEAVFVTATLRSSPDFGSYQTDLTFTGSGFAPNEKVQVYTSGVGSPVLASAVADAGGSFTVVATAPQSPFGPRLFLGTGQRSGKLGAASFSAGAKLVLNPTSGAPGATVTAQGYGFGSLEPVHIHWTNPRTVLGTVAANVRGTFDGSAALTFTVPAGSAPGVYKVLALGQFTSVVVLGSFTVQ